MTKTAKQQRVELKKEYNSIQRDIFAKFPAGSWFLDSALKQAKVKYKLDQIRIGDKDE